MISNPARRFRAAVAIAAVSALAFFSAVPAAQAESFSTARARCAAKLHQSCYAQYLRHIPGHCYVFRGVFNHRIGRTWGCPGSPHYVW